MYAKAPTRISSSLTHLTRKFQDSTLLGYGTQMHLAPLIRDLAVILGVAGLMSLLFQKIRQPVVLGYILAGVIVGPHTPPFQLVTDLPSIQTWAELGVIFLMFTLGLEFSFRKLAKVGGSAMVTASTEVLFFLPAGFFLGRALGWSFMDSVFLGGMLSISSTTIIIKALEELNLKKHRFAELIFGVLIVEDLFAILLLVALGTIAATHAVSPLGLSIAGLQLISVAGGWFVVGYLLVPRFMKVIGRTGSDEMLTIFSLGLCLALVVFASYFHYSTALGAFVMGSILAESSLIHKIEKNMASLRDLFGAIFFVSIGMLIDPRVLRDHWSSVAIICAFTITGKILSTGLGALVSGQSVRNSVRVGFGLAQIGEFSFIIAQLGVTLGAISDFVYPVAVAVSLVTTLTTPYLIGISDRAAGFLESALPEGLRSRLNRYATQTEAARPTGILKWIEKYLLPTASAQAKEADFSHLAPWDAHLVTLELHPNSRFVLNKISEVGLRARFGVNIVAIRRGNQSLVTPKPEDVLLPYDQLVLLGTDDQVQRVRAEFDAGVTPDREPPTYELRKTTLSRGSAFLGKTIRESGIRNDHGAMVVGIERRGFRTISPDSDLRLEEGDVLWITGESAHLPDLLKMIATHET